MTEKPQHSVTDFAKKYAYLIRSLTLVCVEDPAESVQLAQSIAKKLRQTKRPSGLVQYEKAWVTRLIVDRLLNYGYRPQPVTTQKTMDPSPPHDANSEGTEQTAAEFDRLSLEDRLLLTLSEGHSFPRSELSVIFRAPEDSIEMRRQLALSRVERRPWPL